MSNLRIDLEDLLVGQVAALVEAMSNTIQKLEQRPQLEIDERLYRVLAANCEARAAQCRALIADTGPSGAASE